MKKILYLLLLLISTSTMAQTIDTNSLVLPTPNTVFTPQFRYKGTAANPFKEIWGYSGTKWNRWYTGSEVNVLFKNYALKDSVDKLNFTESNLNNATNLSYFGFLPTNAPHDNSIALQKALDKGGNLVVTVPGTYKVDSTHYINSNTKISFAKDVYISLDTNALGESPAYPFVNRGAFTKTYNENIEIHGLKLISNGYDLGQDRERIIGLRGLVSFFYVKNVLVDGYECLDYVPDNFGIQACRWENVTLNNIHLEGDKDGIHIGAGTNLTIDGYICRTGDDAIGVNAFDFTVSNPEIGDITNVKVSNMVELPYNGPSTLPGFSSRFLSGSWLNWTSGMTVQQGDAVVSNGRIYRVFMQNDGATYVSTSQPVNTTDTASYPDGITWYMQQEGTFLNVSVNDVYYKNITLNQAKASGIAFSYNAVDGVFARSIYPGSVMALNKNFTFDNVVVGLDTTLTYLVESRTAEFDYCRIINSRFGSKLNAIFRWREFLVGVPQVVAGKLILDRNIYEGTGQLLVSSSARSGSVEVRGSYKKNPAYTLTVASQINQIYNDIPDNVIIYPTIRKLELYDASQLTAALTDAGVRTGILALNATNTNSGSGGTITFGNAQSRTAGSIGYAAIKGLLSNGTGNVLGHLAFSTRNATSDVALTERMRLVAAGNLLIGTTTDNGEKLQVSGKATVSTAPTNATDVVRKTELDLKANLASPALTGTPTSTTAASGTNTTQIATTAFVQTALTGAQIKPYRTITSATTVLATDYTINVTSGTFSQPLPTTALTAGQIINIKNTGVGTVTVTATSMDGQTSIPLSGGSNLQVQYTGTSGTYIIL